MSRSALREAKLRHISSVQASVKHLVPAANPVLNRSAGEWSSFLSDYWQWTVNAPQTAEAFPVLSSLKGGRVRSVLHILNKLR